MTAQPLADAARELGVSVPTVKRWIGQGCPTARRGHRGRGLSTLVDVADVQRWIAERDAEPEDECAALLRELATEVPGLCADAALETLAAHGAMVQGGAEGRRLRSALGDMARAVVQALNTRLQK